MKHFESVLVVYTPKYKYLIKCADLQNGKTLQELCYRDDIELDYKYEMSEHSISYRDKNHSLSLSSIFRFGNIKIVLRDISIQREYFYDANSVIMIGNKKNATIIESSFCASNTCYLLLNDAKREIVGNLEGTIYINHESKKYPCTFNYGDVIDINGIEYIFNRNSVLVYDHTKSIKHVNLVLKSSCYNLSRERQYYRPGLRLVQPIEDGIIELESPISSEKTERLQVVTAFMPTIIMLCITILSSFIFKRGMYMIIMVLTTISTSFFSYLQQRRSLMEKRKRNEKNRGEYYNYIQNSIKQINNIKKQHYRYIHCNFCDLSKLDKLLTTNTTRVFERKINDTDFLLCRIGASKQEPPYQLKHQIPILNVPQEVEDQYLQSVVDLFNKSYLQTRLVCFKSQTIGLSGNICTAYRQLKSYLAHLVFFHHPKDLNIIVVTDYSKHNEFSDFQYLSHFNSTLFGMLTCIFQEQHIQMCMDVLLRVIKERIANYKDHAQHLITYPHILVVITDIELVRNHQIYQFIQTDLTNVSITLVHIASEPSKLLNATTCLLVFQNDKEASLILDNGKSTSETIYLDDIKVDLTMFIRKLAGYKVKLEPQNIVVDKTSFLDLLPKHMISSEVILNNWANNSAQVSLSAPVGIDNKGDTVFLNVHENYSGPHGIIAGTTGSGKSEYLQCYILSLACMYSPTEVGFLIIDYKGGGMANIFESLPHCRGIVTNLAFDDTLRILKSLKAEILKRQTAFKKYQINHIHQYQSLYDKGEIEIPMPNLIVIVDEFAELKNQVPELFSELISIARIGRSLGIHLILSTQKPTGIVSEQIYANINFRICLRVQSESDSIEMLSDRSAYYLTRPGSALVKSTEFVEPAPFQVGYVHANINIGNKNANLAVFVKDEFGQFVDNISDKVEDDAPQKSQLEVIQNLIEKAYVLSELPKLDAVFQQPLDKKINLDYNTIVYQNKNTSSLKLCVGIVDLPHEQKQEKYYINLENSSSIIFGQDGYGKSNFLKLIITTLSMQSTPSDICIYMVDMKSKLIEYSKLVHVADYILENDVHKASQLEGYIVKTILKRKEMLKRAKVSSLSDYECKHGKINRIILIIDMIDIMLDKESLLSCELIEEVLTSGSKYGIILVATALLPNSILSKLIIHFNNQFALSLPESSNYLLSSKTLLSKADKIPGRMCKLQDSNVIIQMLLSLNKSDLEDLIKCNQQLHKSFKQVKIPVVPNILQSKDFMQMQKCHEKSNSKNSLAIGIEFKTVQLELYNLDSPYMCVCANTHISDVIFKTLQLNESASLFEYHSERRTSMEENTDLITLFSNVENSIFAPKDSVTNIYILNDVDLLMSVLETKYSIQQVVSLLQKAYKLGYYFVVMITIDNISALTMTQRFFMTCSCYLVMNHRIIDSGIQVQQPVYSEKRLANDQCYVIKGMDFIKIKLVDFEITMK